MMSAPGNSNNNDDEEQGVGVGGVGSTRQMSEPLNREHNNNSSTSSFLDDNTDNASQSSQRSSSLLERIRMQREREKQQQQSQTNCGTAPAASSSSRTPSQMQIQVPQYSPVPTSGSDNVNLATGRPDPSTMMMSSNISGGAAAMPMGNHTNPFATDAIEDGGGASGFFRSAWSNIATSMETGMAGLQASASSSGHAGVGGMGEDGNYLLDSSDMEDALLMMPTASRFGGGGAAGTSVDEDYSMCNYFLTFVRDVYLAFVSVPVPGRVIIVIVLLYAAIKLL
jgi:hypothetical protein